MLSTENPPPDPCEISERKSDSSDETICGDNQQQFEVDLFKSGLDDNALPKFSIRDYVFNTRAKDIKNNWPFSQKNLQLCLKHGVKDILPPFQSLDSVRSQECAVRNLRYSDAKHSELSDHGVPEKLAVDIEKINPSEKSEEEREFPSTTTSRSCSGINSAPRIRSPFVEPEGIHLSVSRTEKPEFAVRGPNKVETSIQSPVKKCRLILKLSNIAGPKSNDDSAANTAVVSETMASKVCPVCKTFSSSSNTTLNAHIDQCLSGESSIKWTTNAKVIKHRIKPRKTRLMAEIYETALHCTLADLDRRNGTNWASNLGPPAQKSEACAEEAKKTYSLVNNEDINQEGAVYIDSTGTKLRILSKLSSLPSKPNANDDAGPGFVKSDKGRKLLSSKKKKKYLVQRHKLQKHSLDGQGSCSPISDHLLECSPHGSKSCFPGREVDNGQQKLFHSEGYKEDDHVLPLVPDRKKYDDLGMIKWVGSKRTGLKKIQLGHENQHSDKSLKNLRVKSDSLLANAFSKGNTLSISPTSSDENCCLPTRSHKRKEDLVFHSLDGFMGSPRQRKRPSFPLSKSQLFNGEKNNVMFPKLNVKQSRNIVPSVLERHKDPQNCRESHVSSRCMKKIGTNSSLYIENDGSLVCSNMSQHHTISSDGKTFPSLEESSLGHTISSGSKKFSSLQKKLLSVRHASVAGSEKNLGRKLLNFKNLRSHCTSRADEEEAVWSRSAFGGQSRAGNAKKLKKDSGRPSFNRGRVLKIQKKLRGFGNNDDGNVASEGLETSSPESDSHSVGKNVKSLGVGNVPVDTSSVPEDEAEMLDEFMSKPTYGEAFVSFNHSLDSAFPGLADSSNVESGSQYYNGHDFTAPEGHVMAEMDVNEGQGNYFVDVDPIPIPGPPGSFLPSPGRMCSEELQGHSSLTACRIQSSDDGHEVVDLDPSDSPVSAISAVSNSVDPRSNPISITDLSAQSHFQHESRRHVSEDRSGPAFKGSSSFEQAASGDGEFNLLESSDDKVLPEVSHKVQNISPCCCSRKDGSLQGGSLNYQETQVLGPRTMVLPILAQERQMPNDPKNKVHHLTFGSGRHSMMEPSSETEIFLANLPTGFSPVLVSHKPETVFSSCESPSSSTPNPVLRLMGKNLMVVNKDDDSSPQTRPTQYGMVIDHPGPSLSAENGVSTSNNQNGLSSFHHNLSRDCSKAHNLQPCVPAQRFDFNSSDGFKIPANYGPPQLSAHPSKAMFPSTSFDRNVSSSLNGHASGFNLISDQLRSNIRLNSGGTPIHHLKAADPSGSKHKEIVVIDDTPESEAGLAVNRFYSHQTQAHPRLTGSPTVPNGMNGNLAKWNCILEGSSSGLHSNPSAASLPFNVHLRSSVYFTPGFS